MCAVCRNEDDQPMMTLHLNPIAASVVQIAVEQYVHELANDPAQTPEDIVVTTPYLLAGKDILTKYFDGPEGPNLILTEEGEIRRLDKE